MPLPVRQSNRTSPVHPDRADRERAQRMEAPFELKSHVGWAPMSDRRDGAVSAAGGTGRVYMAADTEHGPVEVQSHERAIGTSEADIMKRVERLKASSKQYVRNHVPVLEGYGRASTRRARELSCLSDTTTATCVPSPRVQCISPPDPRLTRPIESANFVGGTPLSPVQKIRDAADHAVRGEVAHVNTTRAERISPQRAAPLPAPQQGQPQFPAHFSQPPGPVPMMGAEHTVGAVQAYPHILPTTPLQGGGGGGGSGQEALGEMMARLKVELSAELARGIGSVKSEVAAVAAVAAAPRVAPPPPPPAPPARTPQPSPLRTVRSTSSTSQSIVPLTEPVWDGVGGDGAARGLGPTGGGAVPVPPNVLSRLAAEKAASAAQIAVAEASVALQAVGGVVFPRPLGGGGGVPNERNVTPCTPLARQVSPPRPVMHVDVAEGDAWEGISLLPLPRPTTEVECPDPVEEVVLHSSLMSPGPSPPGIVSPVRKRYPMVSPEREAPKRALISPVRGACPEARESPERVRPRFSPARRKVEKEKEKEAFPEGLMSPQRPRGLVSPERPMDEVSPSGTRAPSVMSVTSFEVVHVREAEAEVEVEPEEVPEIDVVPDVEVLSQPSVGRSPPMSTRSSVRQASSAALQPSTMVRSSVRVPTPPAPSLMPSASASKVSSFEPKVPPKQAVKPLVSAANLATLSSVPPEEIVERVFVEDFVEPETIRDAVDVAVETETDNKDAMDQTDPPCVNDAALSAFAPDTHDAQDQTEPQNGVTADTQTPPACDTRTSAMQTETGEEREFSTQTEVVRLIESYTSFVAYRSQTMTSETQTETRYSDATSQASAAMATMKVQTEATPTTSRGVLASCPTTTRSAQCHASREERPSLPQGRPVSVQTLPIESVTERANPVDTRSVGCERSPELASVACSMSAVDMQSVGCEMSLASTVERRSVGCAPSAAEMRSVGCERSLADMRSFGCGRSAATSETASRQMLASIGPSASSSSSSLLARIESEIAPSETSLIAPTSTSAPRSQYAPPPPSSHPSEAPISRASRESRDTRESIPTQKESRESRASSTAPSTAPRSVQQSARESPAPSTLSSQVRLESHSIAPSLVPDTLRTEVTPYEAPPYEAEYDPQPMPQPMPPNPLMSPWRQRPALESPERPPPPRVVHFMDPPVAEVYGEMHGEVYGEVVPSPWRAEAGLISPDRSPSYKAVVRPPLAVCDPNVVLPNEEYEMLSQQREHHTNLAILHHETHLKHASRLQAQLAATPITPMSVVSNCIEDTPASVSGISIPGDEMSAQWGSWWGQKREENEHALRKMTQLTAETGALQERMHLLGASLGTRSASNNTIPSNPLEGGSVGGPVWDRKVSRGVSIASNDREAVAVEGELGGHILVGDTPVSIPTSGARSTWSVTVTFSKHADRDVLIGLTAKGSGTGATYFYRGDGCKIGDDGDGQQKGSRYMLPLPSGTSQVTCEANMAERTISFAVGMQAQKVAFVVPMHVTTPLYPMVVLGGCHDVAIIR